MTSLLRTRAAPSINVQGSRVVYAVAVPDTDTIVAATQANELVYGDNVRVSTEAPVRALACVRYTSYAADSLPEEKPLVLTLVEGVGLRLYSLPDLMDMEGELADQLLEISKAAHTFSVDSLGSDLVGDSFRVAMACGERVSLLDINPTRRKVTVLGEHTLTERVTAVAFSEMTIVASTPKVHHMLRISRGGVLAVAASVDRSDSPKKQTTAIGGAVGDGGAAVLSFFGGLFAKRDPNANVISAVAFALPENRWLLTVDEELVTYSSFGAKVEELENVFKSRSGMNLSETGSVGRGTESGPEVKVALSKRDSVSSLASVATAASKRTFLEEAMATRSEKPPKNTVFSSPFVLSVTDKNEVMAFASNGSLPGVVEQLSLIEGEEKPEPGVKITSLRKGRSLAAAYWPSGRVVMLELVNGLDFLIEEKEAAKELRLALALVPADQVDRMISLRRLLAAEARQEEWHDAAIHHMQNVVNLSVKREGIDQVDLVAEAVELRGPRDGGWQTDRDTSTLWADFLFRLRRRIMRPSVADVDVLETLTRADESATRVKALLSVKHEVPLHTGETLIAANECSLREEERVEALVALYTSLAEHGKALMLLQNSDKTNSFDGVVGYLSTGMRASDDPDAYFSHLKWLVNQSKDENRGAEKIRNLVLGVALDCQDSEVLLGRLFEVLVEDAEELTDVVLDEISEVPSNDTDTSSDKEVVSAHSTEVVSADVLALSMLMGMAKADMLKKPDVFSRLRASFGKRVLHHPNPSYHSYTLLQALQTAENKALGLHEELAFLLGQQGRHEAAADELAAESNLAPEEALVRLTRMLPALDKPSAADSLVAAYLRVSSQRRAMRIQDASRVLRCGGGNLEIEKLLLDGRCSDESLSLAEMLPFLQGALESGNERLRLAEMFRASRKSEVRRLREEVLTRRRRFVVIGHDRACTLCTRRIGDFVFTAYPDGSVAHLACHMGKDGE